MYVCGMCTVCVVNICGGSWVVVSPQGGYGCRVGAAVDGAGSSCLLLSEQWDAVSPEMRRLRVECTRTFTVV